MRTERQLTRVDIETPEQLEMIYGLASLCLAAAEQAEMHTREDTEPTPLERVHMAIDQELEFHQRYRGYDRIMSFEGEKAEAVKQLAWMAIRHAKEERDSELGWQILGRTRFRHAA